MPTPAAPDAGPENDDSAISRLTHDGECWVATDDATSTEGRGATKADALESVADAFQLEPLRLSGRFVDREIDSVRSVRDIQEKR